MVPCSGSWRSCFSGAGDVCSSLQHGAARWHVKETVGDPDSGGEITLSPAFPAAPLLSPNHKHRRPIAGQVQRDKRSPCSLKEMAVIRTEKNVARPFTTLQDASPPKKQLSRSPPEVFLMGLSSRRVCRIVFSAPRGSISVLVWALNGIGLPELLLLLLITPHLSKLEQRQAAREAGILIFRGQPIDRHPYAAPQ